MNLKKLKREYIVNGFVKLKIIKRKDILNFQKSLCQIILLSIKKNAPKKYNFFKNKSHIFILNQGLIFLDRINHSHLVEIYNHINKTNFFQRISNNNKIINIVNYFLGKPKNNPILYNSDSVRMDVPNVKKFLYGWHRDSKFNLYGSNFIQLWCPIVNDANEKTNIGGLEIILNSHKMKIDTFDPVSIKNRKANKLIRTPINVKINLLDKSLSDNDIKIKCLYAELGEAILFSNQLMHRSTQNRSKDKIRYIFNTFYHDLLNEKLVLQDIDQRTSNWKDFFKKKTIN